MNMSNRRIVMLKFVTIMGFQLGAEFVVSAKHLYLIYIHTYILNIYTYMLEAAAEPEIFGAPTQNANAEDDRSRKLL